MRNKIKITYLDDTTKQIYIVLDSFRFSNHFGYVYTAELETGGDLYINRQAVRTIEVTEVEDEV